MGQLAVAMRADSEIDEQLNKAAEASDKGTRWPGMSYEQGVEAALLWMRGDVDDPPIEDE